MPFSSSSSPTDFKTLFTFYKLSGIMKGEPHEEAGQWNNDMIRKPDFP